PVYQRPYRRRVGILQGPRGRLDGVGKHKHRGLLAARLGPGIAEVELVDLPLLECPLVEVAENRRAVVLGDERLQFARQTVLARQLDTVTHMAGEYQVTEVGVEVVVRVLAGELV